MKTISLLFFISIFINSVFGDEVKSVSVMEGDSVTLHTHFTDTQADDVTVLWTFGPQKSTIAKINREPKSNKISINDDVLDGRFRNRLQLNNQTGDLTITDIITQHTGVYEVEITVRSKIILNSFNVNGVNNPESDQLKSVSVKDGDSVTLHPDVPDIKKYDVIQWRFEGIRIAHFNKSASEISEDDDIHDKRFRDKLQLDVQTGSLKIKNIRTDLSGFYEVDLTSTSSGYTIHQSFTVTVSGEVKSVSVMKGESLTIYTDVPDIKTYDQILLIFGCDEKRIAEANKKNKKFTLYGRIRDGLKLNDQAGDLTITDIKTEDTGLYELKMSSRRRTIQRRFSVIISGGQSSGAIAGITIFILLLIAALVAGGIYYHRKIKAEKEKRDVIKILEVDEGKSVHLKTEVDTDLQTVDLIEWRFGETLIAEINSANKSPSTPDVDLFKGKLNLNPQTGDLNIDDIRQKHTGDYTLKIIRDGETSYTRFSVFVRDEIKTLEVDEGKSVDLKTEVKDIKTDDVIEWTFGKYLIAKINPAISSTSDGDDDLFRDKLKLNPQTGDLAINDIRQEHKGVYTLKIIRDEENSYRRFGVFVRDNVEELGVNEEESVNLMTDVADIQRDDVIEWRFKETLIAEINPANNIHNKSDKGLFRDKLKLNDQTGDLNINDIREEHTGVYKLKIIRGGKTSYKTISVSVRCKTKTLEVDEWKSADLKSKVTDIQKDDVIEWRFEKTLIAKINPAGKTFSTYDGGYDLFKDKLKLNTQTGDLTINNIRQKHTGVYTLRIIRDGETSERRFIVFVRGNVEELRVNEEESVDLKTEVTKIQRVDEIEWRFGNKETLIAKINPANNTHNKSDKGLFRDKLKLNHQTGDLNISDIRWENTGVYKLKIIRDGKTSYKTISVSVRCETKTLEVDEGTSVDLKTEVKDIKRDDVIEWRFEETLIATINPAHKTFSTYDGGYDLFKDKLKLNPQTGDLTINNIRQKHKGVYTLKIIRDGETSDKRFTVFVRDEIKPLQVYEGESVDLKTKVKNIKTDDLIEWRFGETLIAQINPANKSPTTSNDDLFRDKLKLNDQTGDLNINDIREKHTGDYKLKIIRNGKTSDKRFTVFVRDEIKPLQVYSGESVDLKTEVDNIKRDDVIEWRFEETLIAEINPANKSPTTSNDDLFRDKLKVNHQTGDLNINDIREKHTGVYKLKIIRDGKTSFKRFNVFVRACAGKVKPVSVNEGESCTLKTDLTDIKRVDLMEWTFGDDKTLIAKINPANEIFSTYNGDDDLFKDKLELNDQTGDLTINDISEDQTGVYILKIIRGEETSYKRFNVFVRCQLKMLEVNEGESVDLKAEVKDIQRVKKIEWRFGETLIAIINPVNNIFSTYDGDKGLFRDKLKLNPQTGDLKIKDIRDEHKGFYKLKIIRDGKTSDRTFNVFVRASKKEDSVKVEMEPLLNNSSQ